MPAFCARCRRFLKVFCWNAIYILEVINIFIQLKFGMSVVRYLVIIGTKLLIHTFTLIFSDTFSTNCTHIATALNWLFFTHSTCDIFPILLTKFRYYDAIALVHTKIADDDIGLLSI